MNEISKNEDNIPVPSEKSITNNEDIISIDKIDGLTKLSNEISFLTDDKKEERIGTKDSEASNIPTENNIPSPEWKRPNEIKTSVSSITKSSQIKSPFNGSVTKTELENIMKLEKEVYESKKNNFKNRGNDLRFLRIGY